MNPAEKLEGEVLPNGWTVGDRVRPNRALTGGHFSVCYKCNNDDGTEAFLKAIDIESAIQSDDFTRALQQITTEYNFERDLLTLCKPMRRIVTSLAFGSVTVSGSQIPVNYIIFELAQSTVRAEINRALIPLRDVFEIMHHVTVGTRQLHDSGIAHQDIKPSNALLFGKEGTKLGDLGRSIAGDRASPFQDYEWPGDLTYAPPEIMFRYIHSDFDVRRYATDLYLLGSLLVSLTTKIPLSAWLKMHLAPNFYPLSWGGTCQSEYSSVLQYVEVAFQDALTALTTEISQLYPCHPEQTQELIETVRELCAPDPLMRGHGGLKKIDTPHRIRYSLERYISRFNRLSTQAGLAAARGRAA